MKKHNLKVIAVITAVFVLFINCTKEPGIPKSLEDIWERNEVGIGAGGGSAGQGNGPGGGAPAVYQGNSAATVRDLLSKVQGWRTASCANCNDGIPPKVNINPNCQRDTHVASAVQFAWAAESSYRLGNTAQAATLVSKMNESLQAARALCGPSTINLGSCLTLSIFPC
jgi:hypothetical protein